nr:Dihydrofolate reductase [uncultured bacterium]
MTDTISKKSPDLSAPFRGTGGKGGIVLSLLVAADEGNVIGKNNQLPWHLPNDLKYFKNLTWGLPIVMGRKTYESIGKPLPGRTNIVITRNKDYAAEGIVVVHTIEEALNVAQEKGAREIFVIGGAEIFNSVFESANRIYLTRIHHRFEGDVFFPELNEDWRLVKKHQYNADEKNAYAHTFQVWERSL